jgi:integrase
VKERATKGFGSMESLNTFLNDQLVKGNDILNDLVKRKKAINRENFKREFFRSCVKLPFFEYCNHQLNTVLKNTLAIETRKSYTTIMQKLNRFKPGVRMEDIDFKFLTAYVNWMKAPIIEKGCGNDDRTIANNLKVVRTMVRLAMKNGDFPEEYYPFVNFPIANTETQLTSRDFLEPEEIMKLEQLLINYVPPSKPIVHVNRMEWKERAEKKMLNPGEYETLKYFLFACYTGLRYKDMFLLDMQEHIKGKWIENSLTKQRSYRNYIDMEAMHKTGKMLIVPLIEKALVLLDLEKVGRAFKVLSNQKTNEHLKVIAQRAEISKLLTFHVARHSFATTCFTYGIPDRVGQKLLGHKNGKFIEIYAHLTQNRLFIEMDKVTKEYNDYEQLLRVVHRNSEEEQDPAAVLAKKMEGTRYNELVEMLGKMDKEQIEKLTAIAKMVS